MPTSEPPSVEGRRRRLPWVAVQSMALVSLDAAAPVPAAVSASEVGLDALPAFAPSQQDEVLLQFAADSSLIERDAEADPYLLLHYAIQ